MLKWKVPALWDFLVQFQKTKMKKTVSAFSTADVVGIRQRRKNFYNKIGHGKRHNKGLFQAWKRTPRPM